MAIHHHRSKTKSVASYSRLAGRLKTVKKTDEYKVSYKQVDIAQLKLYRRWQKLLAYGALILTATFFVILFYPSNWVVRIYKQSPIQIENWTMLVCLALLQVFIVIRTFSATRATLVAKNPEPVAAPSGLRIAFCTTRAPGEPVEMAKKTLLAAKKVKYKKGQVDVWLLDETGNNELQMFCIQKKILYFSRSGIKKWNTEPYNHSFLKRVLFSFNYDQHFMHPDHTKMYKQNDPHFAAKTKHGNFNAWLQYLKLSKFNYDMIAGVDTDQVPLPNYLTRILGYFHDPDVGFVVGPQVYGNYRSGLEGLVARWAESQASFFQSTIQRAANTAECAMLVGTNYAIRAKTLYQVGGFVPCITEDMATGLAIHASKNVDTGNNWKSVYTPDVLAVGEGPDFWGPYFSQQWRWAAGTFDTWFKNSWSSLNKLSLKARLHYLLVLSFYPMSALTWLLAIVSSTLYLVSGASAINAPWGEFFSLYSMAIIMQLSLYFWNRRYNVSPHEEVGSYGVTGMIMTALAAPIYFSALTGVMLGRRTRFVITKKGSRDNPDWLQTFKIQIGWALIEISALVFGISRGRDHPALIAWTVVILVPCILPLAVGMWVAARERRFELLAPLEQIARLREVKNA
jgi:cellulose synthase/poly-beta-1,6-N-acetylglucosamine synthase-like glycosyltransferase